MYTIIVDDDTKYYYFNLLNQHYYWKNKCLQQLRKLIYVFLNKLLLVELLEIFNNATKYVCKKIAFT